LRTGTDGRGARPHWRLYRAAGGVRGAGGGRGGDAFDVAGEGSKGSFLKRRTKKLVIALQLLRCGDTGVSKMNEVFLLLCFQTKKSFLTS
ncbi:MAG TPA: hypothetical protein VL154_09945, partial [Acetobacteraceae bacterium]|nr:hypothetical protein [Acetobacteraceae bacterium]